MEESDFVTCAVKNVKNAEALEGDSRMIVVGSGNLPEAIDEGIKGMKIGETKEISWTPEVEGAEEAAVEVTVNAIKARKLPLSSPTSS